MPKGIVPKGVSGSLSFEVLTTAITNNGIIGDVTTVIPHVIVVMETVIFDVS